MKLCGNYVSSRFVGIFPTTFIHFVSVSHFDINKSHNIARASQHSRSGPENVHIAAEKEYYSKDGVKRIRHVSTKGSGLTTTLFSILYLYRRA